MRGDAQPISYATWLSVFLSATLIFSAINMIAFVKTTKPARNKPPHSVPRQFKACL